MAFALVSVAILWAAFAGLVPAMAVSAASSVTLTPCHVEGVKEELRCGVYNVFENRRTRTGRKLPLKIVLIPPGSHIPTKGLSFTWLEVQARRRPSWRRS